MNLFGIFSKSDSEIVTKVGREVIEEVTEKLPEELKPQKKVSQTSIKPKPKPTPKDKRHFVEFTDGFGNMCCGIVIKSIDISKKYPNTPTVYVVTVLKVDGQNTTPYLKWINIVYCSTMKAFTTEYTKEYFNYDWMNNKNGKKK